MREEQDSTAIAPRQIRLPQVGTLALVAAMGIVLGALATIGVPHWRKLRLIKFVESNGGLVRTEYDGPRWLATWIGERDGDLLNPITEVAADDVNDELLALAAGQPGLRGLSISGGRVTPGGLRHLTSARLETLYLHACALADEDLRFLSGVSNLRTLSLAQNGIQGPGLKHAGGLQQLRQLDVSFNPLTDAGLRYVARLEHLEILDLTGTIVTSAGLGHLRDMPKLQTIRLSQSAINDDAITELGRIRSLREVDLSLTLVSPGGVGRLRTMRPGLKVSMQP